MRHLNTLQTVFKGIRAVEKDKKEKVLGSGGSFNFTWGGQGRPPGGGV